MLLGAGTENLHVNPAMVTADLYGFDMFSSWDVHLHSGFGLIDISSPVSLFGD